MKLLALTTLSISLMAAETISSSTVSAIGYSVDGETTIITIEVSAGFEYTTGRLRQPDRVYFDIPRAKPWINSRASYSQDFDNALVRRVRVAETAPDITRVVLDLSRPVDISVSKSSSPSRLRIALKPALAERDKASAADPVSPGSAGPEVPQSKRQLAQAASPEPPRAEPAASTSSLTLSISPSPVAPGGKAGMIVALNPASNDQPVALQWQMSYPSPQIGIDSGQFAAAVKSAGKTVTCAGKPEGAAVYAYTCIVAGGTTPIESGAIAQFPLQVRDTARTGTVTLNLTGAIAVYADGHSTRLPDSTATLQIQ